MLNRMWSAAGVVGVGISLVAVFAAAAGTAGAAPGGARITSVTFTGTVVNPAVTIVGAGFGTRPKPVPSYRPEPPKGNIPPYGCTTTSAAGNVGYDYGTRLSLADLAAGRSWSAGRYRPSLRELDCVGLVIVSYTATRVVYHLGVDYKVRRYRLAAGDPYQVAVNGAVKHGVVRYLSPGASAGAVKLDGFAAVPNNPGGPAPAIPATLTPDGGTITSCGSPIDPTVGVSLLIVATYSGSPGLATGTLTSPDGTTYGLSFPPSTRPALVPVADSGKPPTIVRNGAYRLVATVKDNQGRTRQTLKATVTVSCF